MLVIVALLCLTACAPVVSGVGQVADTTSQAPATPTKPPATSSAVLRVPQNGPVGDPVTADLCAGISMRELSRFGDARVHGWQTATTCYVDVYRSDATYFQLNSWAESPSDFVPAARTPRRLGNGASVFSFPMHRRDCERALQLDGAVVETHTFNVRGSVPAAVLCGAAAAYLHQEVRAFTRGAPPSRSLASPSLTQFDLCALMSYGNYDRIPGLENATTQPILEAAGCDAYSARIDVTARIAFVELGFPLPGKHVRVQGHALVVYAGRKVCEVVSVQHATRDGRAHELLDVGAQKRPGFTGSLCATTERVAAAMLHAAHLD